MTNNSLAHTIWEYKYYVVFAPKYRRQVIYGKLKTDIGKILRELYDRKGVEITEAEMCKDHVHMLIKILQKQRQSKPPAELVVIIFTLHSKNFKYKMMQIRRL